MNTMGSSQLEICPHPSPHPPYLKLTLLCWRGSHPFPRYRSWGQLPTVWTMMVSKWNSSISQASIHVVDLDSNYTLTIDFGCNCTHQQHISRTQPSSQLPGFLMEAHASTKAECFLFYWVVGWGCLFFVHPPTHHHHHARTITSPPHTHTQTIIRHKLQYPIVYTWPPAWYYCWGKNYP